MSQPLAIDLYCGLGGWTEGLLAAGYYVIGFDIEKHEYGDERYPAQLVLQDVLTLHGAQFKDTALIVASPPCQEFSYMAMPWTRAKAKAAAIRADDTGAELKRLTRLFDACFRIQREACEASGRRIPMVVENVKGAQPWVGRSRWSFGSYHLWGDTPALMPSPKLVVGDGLKRTGRTMYYPAGSANPEAVKGRTGKLHWQDDAGNKNAGGSWFAIGSPGQKITGQNPVHAMTREGVKDKDRDGYERNHPNAFGWKKPRTSSRSSARKAASARVAKIPFALSHWVAKHYLPSNDSATL